MKKINKILSIIDMILLLIYTVLSSYTLLKISKLNILSLKYFVPLLIIGIISIFILYGLSLFKSSILKIISIIITVVGIIMSIYAINYLDVTSSTMKKIMAKDYQTDTYYLLVNEKSVYKEIKDLNNKKIGIHESNSKNYNNSITELEKYIKFSKKENENIIEVGKLLIDKKIDAMLINSNDLSVLDNEIDNFENSIRMIEVKKYKIATEKIEKEVDISDESFNVLLSGVDIYGNISNVSRSDVNIVMTVNPKSHKILLTVIPRDYYVQLHGTTGRRDKLTHAGVYGINTSVKTIEDILNIDINYYVRVNFTTLINVVDSIGGVTVYNDIPFRNFNKGEVYLDGKNALIFSRERKIFASGDVQRGKNQQKVLTAIINKVTTTPALITRYQEFMNTIGDSFETNIDEDKIYKLVNMQIDEMPKWEITSINVTGFDSSDYTYSYPGQLLYVMEPNYDTVNMATNKINETMK